MQNMKKAEMTMGVIVAIVLGVFGFAIMVGYVSQTTSGRQLYCGNIQKYIDRLGIKNNDFCGSAQKLETEYGAQKARNLTKFPNQNTMQLFSINTSQKFSTNLTRDSSVMNAKITIENGNPTK